jgi:F-type H+-transporting ATPase subunit b
MADQHPETTATVEHNGGTAEHAEPTFFGVTAPMFISLAMLAVIGLMIWKRVPGAIAKALDDKIDVIRRQLAEAESLRKDAEALKAEYEARTKSADAEAASILERARHEAEAIVVQAKENAEALVARRQRMAEDKIAAEERSALDQLRATTADAARKAAARLIRERVDAKADEAIVGEAIRSVGTR